MPPKLSVIIPVYNCGEFVERCIRSICQQSMDDIEIIVVNDGSTDNSQLIIDSLIKQYNNIISIKTENYGVSNARNIGIKRSKGEYLLFVDADDYLQIDCLKKIYEIGVQKKASLVFGGLDLYNRNLLKDASINSKKLSKQELICEILTNRLPRTACGILFKSDVIRKNNLKFRKELVYGEDFLFTLSFINHADLLLVIDSLFYKVENRVNSASRLHDLMHIKKVISLEKELKGFINTYNNKSELEEAFICFVKSEIVLSIEKIIMSSASIKNKIKYIKLVKSSSIYKAYFKIKRPKKLMQTKFNMKEKLIQLLPSPNIIFIYYIKRKLNKIAR